MALRGDYVTECLSEINRRIGFIEELETQFKKSTDTGVKNLKVNDDIDDVLKNISIKLNDMRGELYSARSQLADDVTDIGGWL